MQDSPNSCVPISRTIPDMDRPVAEPSRGRHGGYDLAVAEHPRELVDIVEDWRELSLNAAEPNPFYEPWAFLPAAGLEGNKRWQIVTVWRRADGHRSRVLAGLFPFVEERLRFGLRCRRLTLFQHRFCFLTVPLLRAGEQVPVLQALVEHLKTRGKPGLLEFPLIRADGPIQQALIDTVRDRLLTVYYVDQYNRGLLKRSADDAESYLHLALGRKFREVRRQRRRLQERGQLELRTMAPGKVSAWTEWFLDLESRGWKGTGGTAIADQPEHADFFRQMLGEGARAGRVEMLGLFLDGEPIALKCNLRAGAGTFAFKIAYDESLARFSPGLQLELDTVRQFWGEAETEWMDSCASPQHAMISRLWLDRRPIQHVLISTGRAVDDVVLSAAPLARALWRICHRSARRIADALRIRRQ